MANSALRVLTRRGWSPEGGRVRTPEEADLSACCPCVGPIVDLVCAVPMISRTTRRSSGRLLTCIGRPPVPRCEGSPRIWVSPGTHCTQFTSWAFVDAGLVPSMGSIGDCDDNSLAESECSPRPTTKQSTPGPTTITDHPPSVSRPTGPSSVAWVSADPGDDDPGGRARLCRAQP